jgi:2-hydroxychromene-2-carboxylate isomerase
MAVIEYFYAAHSAYAYLGSAAFMEIAHASGNSVQHKPFDLRRTVVGVGSSEMRSRPDNHRDYFFGREMQRWAEHRQIPMLAWPTHHANDITLSNCVLIAAQNTGANIDALAHSMLKSHWVDNTDLADTETLVSLTNERGLEGAQLVQAATSDAVVDQYQANTKEAIERSVFGSPTYFIDGDMFYGQDRLEMVARALRQPYAGEWPR